MTPAKSNPSLVELVELCDAVYYEKKEWPIELPDTAPPARAPEHPSTPLRTDFSFGARDQPLLTSRTFGFTPSLTNSACFPPEPASRKITWKMSKPERNAFGFYCAKYTRDADGTSILAFRGTDDLWDGLRDDRKIFFGGVPPQIDAALRSARSAGLGKDTYVTGHSLGGALAIITAAHLNVPAVTFNAPGVMDACVQTTDRSGLGSMLAILRRCLSNSRILNKRIEGDPVSSWFTTGLQTGGRTRGMGAAQCGLDPLCRHGIKTCIAAARQDKQNFLPLKL